MANKIFTLSNSRKNTIKKPIKEVYKDISIFSYPKNNIYEISKNINVDAVKTSIHNIFSWNLGERILYPEFGSKLKYYLYTGITDFNIEKIVSEIKNIVLKYEPRVEILKIENNTTILNKEENTINLNIIYVINGLPNSIFNYEISNKDI